MRARGRVSMSFIERRREIEGRGGGEKRDVDSVTHRTTKRFTI